MTHDDYVQMDATALAEGIRKKSFSASEALDAALARLDAVNPQINAVVHRAEAFARAQIIEGHGDSSRSGFFAGVPFLVKDLSLQVNGLPMTNGSGFFRGYVPDFDNTLTQRQRAAGLVIFGRTASPEFGLGPITEPANHGPCRNPWSLGHQTGGSSGGSAAAIAAGIVPMAHATDGGGSIRMPAAHCGLFGLKPTRGRLPSGPVLGEAWNGVAVPHVISRSVRDSAAMLDLTAGASPGDPYAAPGQGPWLPLVNRPRKSVRIALSTVTPAGLPVHPEVRAGVEAAGRLLESLGHHVEEAQISIDLDEMYRHFWLISGTHVAALFTARAKALGRPPGPDEIEPATRAIIARARAASAEDYVRALQWMHALGRKMGAFFERCDVALTPVYANPPLPVGSLSMQTADFATYSDMLQKERPFTAMYNLSGGPAMSVPLHWTPDGLPVGVHFGADMGREDLLIQLAGQLEQAAPWAHRRPALERKSSHAN